MAIRSAQENWERAKGLVEAHPQVLSSFRLRTVTMGFNLIDSIDNNIGTMTNAVVQRLAAELPVFNEAITEAIQELSGVIGTSPETLLQTRRATVTPIESMTRSAVVNGGATEDDVVSFASTIDATVRAHLGYPQTGQNVFLGGGGFLANRGLSSDRDTYLKALPGIMKSTQVLNVDITVGSTHSGIHLDSVRAAAQLTREIGKNDIVFTQEKVPDPTDPRTWRLTPEEMKVYNESKQSIQSAHPQAIAYPFFSNLARVAVFVNAPEENPFMAGGFAGLQTPTRTVSVGINGAGVIQQAILAANSNSINDIVQSIKEYASHMYNIAEAVRFKVIDLMKQAAVNVGESDGIVDLSVAATNDRDKEGKPTNSIASALSALGVEAGAHGSVAAVGLIIDNLKKAGSGAITYAGGLSGTFIPVSEDAGMADAVAAGWLTFPRFLSMTSVCSVGTDMFAAYWPQDLSDGTFEAHVAGMFLDEMAIGVYTNKTTSARILPVPYVPRQSLWVVLMGGAGLLGNAPIMDLNFSSLPSPEKFVGRNGALPAPITSFRN